MCMGVFGDGLGALRHGGLALLIGHQEVHAGQRFPEGDGGVFVMTSKLRRSEQLHVRCRQIRHM